MLLWSYNLRFWFGIVWFGKAKETACWRRLLLIDCFAAKMSFVVCCFFFLCASLVNLYDTINRHAPMPETCICNPLVAILGIGNYNGMMPELIGIPKDYQNVAYCMNWKHGYSFVYQTKDNELKFHESRVDRATLLNIEENCKLKWDLDEINAFVENVRNLVVNRTNYFDSLIFFVSSHGNSTNEIYDSDCEEIRLTWLFEMFNNQNLRSLANQPKIFVIDACRGMVVTARKNVNETSEIIEETEEAESKSNYKFDYNKAIATNNDEANKADQEPNIVTKGPNNSSNEKRAPNNNAMRGQFSTHNAANDNKNISSKVYNVEKKQKTDTYMEHSDIIKIFANTPGCAVADAGKKGLYFMCILCMYIYNIYLALFEYTTHAHLFRWLFDKKFDKGNGKRNLFFKTIYNHY